MPRYLCLQRQEYIWLCPLNLEQIFGKDHDKAKGHQCDKWYFDECKDEFDNHLKEHGIEDTKPIGSGIIL